MNAIYRLVWSQAEQCLVVVSEIAKGRGKSGGKSATTPAPTLRTAASLLIAAYAISAGATATNALPTGGQVTAGTAAISSTANTLTVTQGSQRAAINWQSFSIGSGATVNFVQPNASSVILNRVVGNEQSVIAGAMNANGQVFLLNSSGVLFTGTARVDVGGLVASTLNLSDADFMAARSTFIANGSRGSVINLGTLNAADGGYVALLGNQVKNEGVITARLGTAIMAAGDQVSLNFNGDSLVGVTIDQGTLNALVENKQAIYADGGLVVLTAKGLDTVMATVVNNTGEIRAQTVANREGKIYLLGGMENNRIEVGGTLDASAPNGGNGGFVETSAASVQIKDGVRVTTQAAQGTTGNWLIDPNDYTVAASGGNITGAALGASLGGSNVTISTATQGTAGGNGDIFVNDSVTWTSGHTLTLTAERNIKINAKIDASGGSGGAVALYYGQGAVASGNTATYDFGLTPSGFSGKINLQSGSNFSTKLGSNGGAINYTVITQLGGSGDETSNPGNSLQGLAATANLTGNFVLGANIDASATSGWNGGEGFVPIGKYTARNISTFFFTGKFDGLGHTITGLTIHRPSDPTSAAHSNQALFGYLSGNAAISNIGIINATIEGYDTVGALVGEMGYNSSDSPTITNSYASSSHITAARGEAGGLVGDMAVNSKITRSFVSGGTVTAVDSGAGGFVGDAEGGVISDSYTTANVTGGNALGGFAGWGGGTTIQNSYATGDVGSSGAQCAYRCGGFAGDHDWGTISNSYALGRVYTADTATSGAFVGQVESSNGTITASFWDATRTGSAVGFGTSSVLSPNVDSLTQSGGLATSPMQTLTTFNGSAAWSIVADNTLPKNYPQLRWTAPGVAAGSSVWVMGTGQPVNYSLINLNRVAGTAVTLPNPSYTGGSPTGTSTVKVYDAQNNDVTGLALAGTLAVGSYTMKATLNDSTYAIDLTGNANGTLTITAAAASTTTNTTNAVASAITAPQIIQPPSTGLPGSFLPTGGVAPGTGQPSTFVNVTTPLPFVTAAFGPGERFAVISSPSASEPTQAVTLSQARSMMQGGGAQGADRVVRVPVSRNSLEQIVNGGLNLPTGVEQELFVVQSD